MNFAKLSSRMIARSGDLNFQARPHVRKNGFDSPLPTRHSFEHCNSYKRTFRSNSRSPQKRSTPLTQPTTRAQIAFVLSKTSSVPPAFVCVAWFNKPAALFGNDQRGAIKHGTQGTLQTPLETNGRGRWRRTVRAPQFPSAV